MARFEKEMGVASRDIACCSYGMLTPPADARQILDKDPVLRPLEGFLDLCGYTDGFWNLCPGCNAALLRGSAPKFSAMNKINVTLCQNYPEALTDLTLTEEYLIAKSHPVGVVLKLRPSGRSSPANYHALRGHFIIIPQNPKPLLQILPSPELQFTELIKVFWIGKHRLNETDLRPFLIVRKTKVLAALQFLTHNNPLYQDVQISHSTMAGWPDDFIPSAIQQDMICLDETDHDERTGYSVNLQEGNFENDWQAAEDDSGHLAEDFIPVTSSVTIDLNGDRQNHDLRLLNTVQALSDRSSCEMRPEGIPADQMGQSHSSDSPHHRPVIEYCIQGQALLLNQWQDHHYFTSAFPTLFPTGEGGHLENRETPVSLAAFANWALRHHSRKYARLRDCILSKLTGSGLLGTGHSCTCYMMSSSCAIRVAATRY
jgi:hypothetical protein